MGAGQSTESGGRAQITETANFDFRDELQRRPVWGAASKPNGQSGSCHHNNNSGPKVSQEAIHWNTSFGWSPSERGNAYWVEEGLDAVQRTTVHTHNLQSKDGRL